MKNKVKRSIDVPDDQFISVSVKLKKFERKFTAKILLVYVYQSFVIICYSCFKWLALLEVPFAWGNVGYILVFSPFVLCWIHVYLLWQLL